MTLASIIGGAVPVPGGLGVVEAGLIADLPAWIPRPGRRRGVIQRTFTAYRRRSGLPARLDAPPRICVTFVRPPLPNAQDRVGRFPAPARRAAHSSGGYKRGWPPTDGHQLRQLGSCPPHQARDALRRSMAKALTGQGMSRQLVRARRRRHLARHFLTRRRLIPSLAPKLVFTRPLQTASIDMSRPAGSGITSQRVACAAFRRTLLRTRPRPSTASDLSVARWFPWRLGALRSWAAQGYGAPAGPRAHPADPV
jgi:hypothetical protein